MFYSKYNFSHILVGHIVYGGVRCIGSIDNMFSNICNIHEIDASLSYLRLVANNIGYVNNNCMLMSKYVCSIMYAITNYQQKTFVNLFVGVCTYIHTDMQLKTLVSYD